MKRFTSNLVVSSALLASAVVAQQAAPRNDAIAPAAEHVADVLAKSTGKWETVSYS